MSNKESENLLPFTIKAVIIGAVVVIIVRSIINNKNDVSNQGEETNIESAEPYNNESYTEENGTNSVGFDPRVPLCPAKPNGAKVAPGAGSLFGADEHVNCKDYCLVDREKELQQKLDAQRREQRIQYMERQLND